MVVQVLKATERDEYQQCFSLCIIGSDTYYMIDVPIKVVNSTNKHESKAYMLSLQLEKMTSLKHLQEGNGTTGEKCC